ncbi:MAG: hypothetical protein IT371_13690 [Deltaproteobacteria bacterium]|nr:hypothetical protein [Deltaproteobacteria bacterium]
MDAMENLTFRGLLGEVLRLFVRAGTLFTVLPAYVAMTALAATVAYLASQAQLPPLLFVPLLNVAISPIIGHLLFGVVAGDPASGLLSKGVPGAVWPFVGRYAILTILWQSAWAAAAWLLLSSVPALLFTQLTSPSAALVGLLFGLLALLVAALLLVPASVIVAARARSLRELLTGEPWGWLFNERGSDLVPLLAGLVGGVVLFSLLAIPLMLLVALLVAKVWRGGGAIIFVLAYVTPVASIPVLLGRLCGAFLLADEAKEERVTIAPPPAPALALPRGEPAATPSMARASAPVADPLDLRKKALALAGRPDAELDQAIAEAEALRAQAPHHPVILGELAKLNLRAGRADAAIAAGREALRQALRGGSGPIAAELYGALEAHRKDLGLEGPEYDQLARILLNRNAYDDAVWCFRAAEVTGADGVRVQKGIISVAEAALRGGDEETALRFFRYFLKTYPASDFVGYCQGEIGRLERKRGPKTS